MKSIAFLALVFIVQSGIAGARELAKIQCETYFTEGSVSKVVDFISTREDPCGALFLDQSLANGRYVVHVVAGKPILSREEFSFVHLEITDTVTGARSKWISSRALIPLGTREMNLMLLQDKIQSNVILSCKVESNTADITCHPNP